MTFFQLFDPRQRLANAFIRSARPCIQAALALMATVISAQQPALPPELGALNQQFIKLQKEQVTAPFESDLVVLNTGYLGAIDKAVTAEKAAANLDGILALEAEKKLITEKALAAERPPLPQSDDEKTPAVVKNLRNIYRTSYAKLEAQRLKNLQKLVAPLNVRLKQMEADFVKADRIADAKTVHSYREALAEEAPAAGEPKPAATLNPAVMITAKDGFTNTLGMKFLPVKGTAVLFCIHEVRYKDYAAYAAENPNVDVAWKDQTVEGHAITDRKEDHPVIKVSWDDAQKFCAWLSQKEGKLYRLPTDEEWSYAAGIGEKEKRKTGALPFQMPTVPDVFPWGDDFPLTKKNKPGNFRDASLTGKAPGADGKEDSLETYDDGFPTTAPVMSFKPNKLGLYDLGGNVWEWCEDWYDNAQQDRELRGASWHDNNRGFLLSSYRLHGPPGGRHGDHGFRCVVVPPRGLKD
ncbi:formylglycine-generating enzyme family protein [Prosthecobacter fluviatilis]|uniref:Formylglycine-generating enzyme family protein n=1 Tax=Prosthecobacter fluviatilis TaxID=445931 RepID=A0ABW0KU45_9BACT